jgi:Fe-S-cluster-containing hydrogenase component 2
MALKISGARCPQNHRCPLLVICPVGAISQQGNGLPVIDNDKCIECGKCTRSCGMGAVYNDAK